MKTNTKRSEQASTPQTVTEPIELKIGKKTIRISSTNQKLSAHAGQATLAGFFQSFGVRELLARALPQRPTSPNALAPVEIALGFMTGVVAGADKLTRVAWLRGDPVLPHLFQLKRLPSQSTLSRFFAGFSGLRQSLGCFQPLWHATMEHLPVRPEGYTLDLDSTSLLHEDGHQEGVKVGYTRVGLKPCLHPLLASLAEAQICAQFWLRPGNSHSANNVLAFTETLLANLPEPVKIRLVRADSGFQSEAWISLLEGKGLDYIVVADFSVPIKNFIRRETCWQATEMEGVEVADEIHDSRYVSRPRRLVLLRRRLDAPGRGGGKMLLDCPGYKYQALLTSLPLTVAAVDVWREYNGRANLENLIKELKGGFGLGSFCCRKFYATEAALSLAVWTYNLIKRFSHRLKPLATATITTLRHRLFHCAGIISRSQNRITLKLGIPPAQRTWWQSVWDQILHPKPYCDAVEIPT